MTVHRLAREVVECLDKSGVVGRPSREEDLAFAEESLHAQMMRIRQNNAAFHGLKSREEND